MVFDTFDLVLLGLQLLLDIHLLELEFSFYWFDVMQMSLEVILNIIPIYI